MKAIKNIIKTVDAKQCAEFGMVAILVIALLGIYKKQVNYLWVVSVLSVLTLLIPLIFYPFAVIWSGLGILLGAVSSRIILTLIFFLVVTPIGLFRKLLGKDDMKLKQFKKDRQSAMKTREHLYGPDDFLHTF